MGELKRVNEPKTWWELEEFRGNEWQWVESFDELEDAEQSMVIAKAYDDVPYRIVECKGKVLWRR